MSASKLWISFILDDRLLTVEDWSLRLEDRRSIVSEEISLAIKVPEIEALLDDNVPATVASLFTVSESAMIWPEKEALPPASITTAVLPARPLMINLANFPAFGSLVGLVVLVVLVGLRSMTRSLLAGLISFVTTLFVSTIGEDIFSLTLILFTTISLAIK